MPGVGAYHTSGRTRAYEMLGCASAEAEGTQQFGELEYLTISGAGGAWQFRGGCQTRVLKHLCLWACEINGQSSVASFLHDVCMAPDCNATALLLFAFSRVPTQNVEAILKGRGNVLM